MSHQRLRKKILEYRECEERFDAWKTGEDLTITAAILPNRLLPIVYCSMSNERSLMFYFPYGFQNPCAGFIGIIPYKFNKSNSLSMIKNIIYLTFLL